MFHIYFCEMKTRISIDVKTKMSSVEKNDDQRHI